MKDFFSALTDRSFDSFITRQVAGVLYLISMIFIGLAVGIVLIAGFILFGQGDLLSGFVTLVFAPLLGLLLLILTRLFFESGVALVLIAENTRK